MKSRMKNILAAVLCIALLCSLAGCQHDKKEPRPAPKSTAKVDDGNTNAAGSGEGQSDVPLVVGCQPFSGQFNPFTAETPADRQVVSLTQVQLITHDRAGKTIYHGIDGELREYNGNSYTYYGIADIVVEYREKEDETDYHIALRDDLVFSDGEKLTVDDLIFSLYVFCDRSYYGDVQLKGMPIKGLLEYQADGSKANSISGIQRVNDYELTLVTTGYNRRMTAALEIPVCALHYYGDAAEYNAEMGKFGFTRGDISQVAEKKTAPMGAGAYCFVKHENNVVYYTSNELYYLGCPETAYLQLKDMTDILKETRVQIKTRQKEYQEWEESQAEADSVAEETNSPETASVGPGETANPGNASPSPGETANPENASPSPEETGPEPTPMPSVNPLAEVAEIAGGTVDVMRASYSKADLSWIYGTDSKEQIGVSMVGDNTYHYIGVNAKAVSVKGKAESKASGYLRKALAVVLSDSRRALIESEEGLAELVDYPVVKESWVSPQQWEDDYATPYSVSISGESNGQTADMALEYLEAAGYTVSGGKVKKAPKGGAVKYKVLVVNGRNNPLYPIVEQAQKTFEDIGITLEMVSVGTERELYKKLSKNKHQLWAGSRPKEDLELQLRYSEKAADNFFGIQDKKLDRIIDKLQTRISSDDRRRLYRKAFDIVLEWAVEVPVCEFQGVELFSTRRINESTLAKDTTIYYSWMNEIQKVRMK